MRSLLKALGLRTSVLEDKSGGLNFRNLGESLAATSDSAEANPWKSLGSELLAQQEPVAIPPVDGRNPAPPQRPWKDDSPVNTNKEWLPMISKKCEMDFVHPQYHLPWFSCL